VGPSHSSVGGAIGDADEFGLDDWRLWDGRFFVRVHSVDSGRQDAVRAGLVWTVCPALSTRRVVPRVYLHTGGEVTSQKLIGGASLSEDEAHACAQHCRDHGVVVDVRPARRRN